MRVTVFAALTGLAAPAAAADLAVVTDLPAVHSVVSTILGPHGHATLLLPAGGDPHHMVLRPSDAAAIGAADLVIWAGPEISPWMADAIATAGAPDLALVAAGTHETDGHDGHGHADHGHDDHAHGGDLHPWLDPLVVADWTGQVADRLATAAPTEASAFAEAAEALSRDLHALVGEVEATLAPMKGMPLLVYHDAYDAFAERFDLTIAAAVSGGEADRPGARHVAELRALVAAGEIACAFAEAQHDARLLDTITEGYDIPRGTLDPSGSALPPGPGLYPALIRGLADEIAGCTAE